VPSRARDADKKVNCVYQMMLYLCRCDKHGVDRSKLTLEYAEHFLYEQSKPFKVRTLAQIWEDHKQSAPYIFAFHPVISPIVAHVNSIGGLVDALEPFAKDQGRLEMLLGAAAHAADALAGMKVRDVRLTDFKKVTRAAPQLEVFSADELHIIDAIDPKKRSKKDAQPWRPKPMPRKAAQ
jgi:hypothetical protein